MYCKGGDLVKKVREGYKMTKLGEIPNEWRILKLSEIAEINPRRESLDDNSIVSFIAMEDISNSGRIINKIDRLYGEVKKGYTPFKNNDILLAKITPCFENGKRALVKNLSNGIGFGSTEFHVLRPYKESISRFLYYVISSYKFMSKAENNMIGSSGQKRVPTEFIKEYVLAVPTIKEQEKIVSILSAVDEQIDNVDALIDKNKELKKGLMQTLLTKGIGHIKFKKTDIGEIPEEWKIEYLDNMAKRYSGHTPNKQREEYWNGNIPWISLKDTKKLDNLYINETEDYTTELGIQNSSAVKLPKGTVVISRDATVGKVGITKSEYMATSQHFINYVCSNSINNIFLYYYLFNKKSLFERIGVGSTIKTIGLSFFKELKIAVPSIQEQEKIASILFKVDEKIEEYENRKRNLEIIKKGLIQKLLKGEIRGI